ncbi:MAG: ABC transporter ATP-binding protein [Gemmatimonadetes bacterium]|nr:ABC transporter ATP-binding protein [Gemmatimonadota bacterium]
MRDLTVAFARGGDVVRPVDGISLELHERECLVLLGESGSGKSLTALSTLRLEPQNAILSGHIRYEPGAVDLISAGPDAIRSVRGRGIAMVFQEPMTALNPVLRCGEQIAEAIRMHARAGFREANARALALLDEVGMDDPVRVAGQYPHELSGGMRQRVLTAIALAGDPKILVADEPTTALDVSTEQRILDLLLRLRAARGLAILMITHDWGVAAAMADRVSVLYAGQVVETGAADAVLRDPRHPYTRALHGSVPRLGEEAAAPVPIPGQVPEPGAFPPGCRFHPRCARSIPACSEREPALVVRDALGVRCDVENGVTS